MKKESKNLKSITERNSKMTKVIDIKIPKAFIRNTDIYEFDRIEYQGCYRYKHAWYNGYGEKKYFYNYLEKHNILYRALESYLRKDKDYWSKYDIDFIF